MWLVLTTSSFKLIRIDEITQLVDGMYQTGRWPVGIYPGWFRGVLTYLVPLAFAVTVPAQTVTGRLTGGIVVLSVVIAGVAFVVSRLLFLRQLRSYSGASA